MSTFLLIDIGAGTMDILCYDAETGISYKAVVKSPILSIAEKISGIERNLLIDGVEMGGGAVSMAIKEKARDHEVIMSASSAATIHHDLDRVRSSGVRVVGNKNVAALKKTGKYEVLTLGDLEIERLRSIIGGFGVPFSFQAVGICAQDHGVPPKGVSHLDYRHEIFKERLDENPFPHALLFRKEEVPATLNRLRSIAESAAVLPAEEIYVMDSGMAAILGASMDRRAAKSERMLVLDIATSHTVGAAIERGEIAGFFEYHTQDITVEKIDYLLEALCDGKLMHEAILAEGGHGAYNRKAFGFRAAEIIIATGPKRRLLKGSGLPIELGAPFGDNMMTGTVGLLESIRRRKNMPEFDYL